MSRAGPLREARGAADGVPHLALLATRRARAWDRIDGDFVERVIEDDTTPCRTLGSHWVVRPVDLVPAGLRLADDSGALLRTATEEEAEARLAAEARIRELEEELRRR